MQDTHEYFEYEHLYFAPQGVVLSNARLKQDLEPFYAGDVFEFAYFNVGEGHIELIDFGVSAKYRPAKDGKLVKI